MECRLCISVQKNGVCPIYNIFGNCIMNPQITVIIPAYRRKNYLFFALDRILAQKEVTMEILVFSEVMGPDEVDEVEKTYPQVKYFKTDEYKGASAKRRAGVKMAKGKYLYLPDDDDYLTDDTFLKRALEVMEEDNNISFVSGLTDISYEYAECSKNHFEHRKLPFEGIINGIQYLQELSTVSTLFRKQAILARDIDKMYEISDVCLYLNALLTGDAFIINEPVAVYRFHEKNLTYSLPFWFMFNVLKEKERIYCDAQKSLPRPKDFWYNHFRITYLFYKDGKATFRGKLKMLLWCLMHLHANLQLCRFVLKEFVKLFIRR